MNLRVSRSLALAAALLPFAGSTSSAETLFDALAQAYASNPTLLAQRASVRAVDEGVPQALSGWRPTVSAEAGAGLRQSKSSGNREQDLIPLNGGLSVTQPLYRGGRTVAGTMSAESNVLAARQTLRSVEQSVLLDGVRVYLDVLRDQARVQLTKNNEAVLTRQLEASRDRFEVGEITRTDVAQSEARLSNARAQRVSAEGDLAASRASFEQVIGRAPGALEPAPELPGLPGSLAEAIELAQQQNPDVAAARETETAAGHDVRVASGRMLPSVDLVGSVQRSDETSFEDVSNRNDSLIAQVKVPLYQAGSVSSQVRQAKEVRNQRRIEIEIARRAVVEEARQAWEALIAARSQISAREQEVRANEIALEGVKQEAAVGSRTTLDVLDAEQELLDSRVALVISDRDEYVTGYRLLAAVGGLTASGLGLQVAPYDPGKHLQQVRDKWWGIDPPSD
jgi:TolC family type I secretion outer membrane protein